MRISSSHVDRRLRWQIAIVAVAMLAVVALAVIRFWFVSGLWQTYRIDGNSMAENLLGAHFRVQCDDCGILFRCDALHVPAERLAVCPNCGYARNLLLNQDVRPGERVLVDRWPLAWRLPRRGEIVMASSPDESPWPIVKRVAGLPGETLEIRRGDLFANRQIIRKSLPEMREVATLVYDNNFQPQKSALPARWQAETAVGGWEASGNGFEFQPSENTAGGELDWLVYNHWSCVGGPIPRTNASAVLDNDSFNQAESRQLNSVTDLLLTCRVQLTGEGQFSLALNPVGNRYAVVLSTREESISLTRDEHEITQQTVRGLSNGVPHLLEFALCDQQLLFSLDSIMVFRISIAPTAKPVDELHPLAIGARDLIANVSDIQIWRDIYYLEPWGTGRKWQADAAVPARGIALLGDNPTISTDSRHWPHAGIPLATISGKVLRPDWLEADPRVPLVAATSGVPRTTMIGSPGSE